MEKAYKLLAIQKELSNSKAKNLIDRGLVYIENKRVTVARKEYSLSTKFNILETSEIAVIFEDDDLIAINKPPFLNSEDLLKKFKKTKLLHRLDRETSGLIILTKNEDFREKAIKEFINNRVYKEYVAIVHGKVVEDVIIDEPIMTFKAQSATSVISKKGKPSLSKVYPLELHGKKSKIKVVIETGRTHQIRVHLAYIDHPVVGDETYGINSSARRLMLHSKAIKILDYDFSIDEPKEFAKVFSI